MVGFSVMKIAEMASESRRIVSEIMTSFEKEKNLVRTKPQKKTKFLNRESRTRTQIAGEDNKITALKPTALLY